MIIIADMHSHTIASGHAYSTVNEMAAEAARKGLRALALTDHGPAMPGGPHLYHFGAMRFIPPWISGVRILRGAEANITGADGAIDLPETYLARLDYVMAGFHTGCGFEAMGVAANTDAVLLAMRNPLVRGVAHPGNPEYQVDLEALVQGAVETGTALEINNSSLSVSRRGSRHNCEQLARLIARKGALVVVGSDAHIAQGVGEFGDAVQLLARAGVAEDQVVNSSFSRLMEFLGIKENPDA